MERTPTSRATFAGKRTVVVRETAHFRFSVTITARTFALSKHNLSHERASAMTLLALIGARKSTILKADAVGRMKVRMGDSFAKAAGIEWLALRMASGDNPMILKAPRMFKNKEIIITPTERPTIYTVTLTSPHGDERVETTASQEAVEALLAVQP